MKFYPFVIFAVLASAEFVTAQNESVVMPATARILGKIPDGTPPPPAAPKPKYKVDKSDILQTTTHEQGGRTITIQQINPISLPPPPPPAPAEANAIVSAEFQQRLAEYREAHPHSGMMFMGATVYRSENRPPRTLIRVWPEGGGEAVELWSSADMALIAGGINSFMDSAGNIHQPFIAWSNVSIDRLADRFASKGRKYTPPTIPEFPAGKAMFQVVGKPLAPADLTAIQSLHDLYNSEHDRLQTACEGRERTRQRRDAELKAHPPQPKDLTLRFWHTKRPALQHEGGAR